MINDLVSIVMPVFHAEAFLEKTVETVQEQTYKNWELIAVDDCSGDGSFELLCRLAEADGRIRPVRQEHNQGAAASRNKGVELAQGRYLAYLDADDLWTKTNLEKELAFLKEKQAALGNTSNTIMTTAADNTIQRLQKLKNLFELGLISEEEYKERKKEILEEI